MVAADFKALVRHASDEKLIQIGALRSHYDGILVIAAHVLQQCLQEQQVVNNFVSSLQLTIRSHPTVVEEREAILAVAKRGSKVVAEWIKLLDVESPLSPSERPSSVRPRRDS
jgi:hypothetical protein